MDLPFPLIPLRLIGLELVGALDALIEGRERMLDGGLVAEHVGVFEEHPAGMRIDFDIGHQRRPCDSSGMAGFAQPSPHRFDRRLAAGA